MMRVLATVVTGLVTLAGGPSRMDSTFVAALDGDHAIPPVITSAGGTLNLRIEGDSLAHYQLQVAQIKDVWSAGIYSAANGGLKAVTLFVGPANGEVSGVLAQGTFTNKDMLGGATMKQLAEAMRKKQAYVEVLTAAHPGGEIRGQIVPAAEWEQKVASR
jgi:hypothetical protein